MSGRALETLEQMSRVRRSQAEVGVGTEHSVDTGRVTVMLGHSVPSHPPHKHDPDGWKACCQPTIGL